VVALLWILIASPPIQPVLEHSTGLQIYLILTHYVIPLDLIALVAMLCGFLASRLTRWWRGGMLAGALVGIVGWLGIGVYGLLFLTSRGIPVALVLRLDVLNLTPYSLIYCLYFLATGAGSGALGGLVGARPVR
jgi:hypothetical protein